MKLVKCIFYFASVLIFANAFAGQAYRCEPGRIIGFASRFIQDSCFPLSLNNPQKVAQKKNNGTLDVSYRLTKKTSDSYLAEINPAFVESKAVNSMDSLSGIADISFLREISQGSPLHQSYSKKMSYCLDLYEPYLRGPDGEKLSIKLSRDKKVPPVNIGIDAPKTRTTYHNYAKDIDCPTILHEVLHILGLVDEYPERSVGYIRDPHTGVLSLVNNHAKIYAYDCRAIGPKDSVMNTQDEAILGAVPMKLYDQTTCACAQDPIKCYNFIQSKGESIEELKNCPSGFKSQHTKVALATNSDLERLLDRKLVVANENESVFDDENIMVHPMLSFDLPVDLTKYKNLPYDGRSILKPAQFRLITSPYCYKENKDYIECSKYAYVTSVEQPDKKCSPEAKKCQSNRDWLK